MSKSLLKFISLGLALFAITLASSCVPTGSSLELRMTDAAANNHIMFVRENPPTFGNRRLLALANYYPDLYAFMELQGTPRFLAETNKSGNRYLILYYPEIRKQFVCRSGTGQSRAVEFSGPHPVTPGELKTLEKIETGTENTR
jgi:hypothetical protein